MLYLHNVIIAKIPSDRYRSINCLYTVYNVYTV